jgi:hypothetical protein
MYSSLITSIIIIAKLVSDNEKKKQQTHAGGCKGRLYPKIRQLFEIVTNPKGARGQLNKSPTRLARSLVPA